MDRYLCAAGWAAAPGDSGAAPAMLPGKGAGWSCEHGSPPAGRLFQQPRPSVLGKRWAILRRRSSSTPSSSDWLRRALQGCTGARQPPSASSSHQQQQLPQDRFPRPKAGPGLGQAWQGRGRQSCPAQPPPAHLSEIFVAVKIDGCANLICRAKAVKAIAGSRGERYLLSDSYFCR